MPNLTTSCLKTHCVGGAGPDWFVVPTTTSPPKKVTHCVRTSEPSLGGGKESQCIVRPSWLDKHGTYKTNCLIFGYIELNPNPAEGGPNWPTSWFLDFNCAVTPNMNTWQPCKFIFSLISMENCFFGRVWPYFPKFSNGRPIRAPLGWFLRNR